jgi:acyl carrier protein phosphodiesterase
MNYLAHAYLSFNQPEILVGNMISDYVKGKQKFLYEKRILAGIDLHRVIDTFTDAHIVTHQAAEVFKPAVRLYSGAFIDVVYDHFLALDHTQLNEKEWFDFSLKTYQNLTPYQDIFPERFAKMFPYMRDQNWLFNYRYKQGIENSFKGLAHRAKYLQSSEAAFDIFENQYDFLQDCYNKFFPSLKQFVIDELAILNR